jgi:CheY-like chemotaxis protein
VLVMDDDAMVRSVALRMLAELGFDAEGANDGRKALEMYKEARDGGAPFDAVIMDLTVPAGMGGREMIERLRAIDPAVKAIVSSGYSNDPVMAEFARYGFSGMVMKPYRIEDLSAMLHQVLKVQRQ